MPSLSSQPPIWLRGGDARHRTGGVADEMPARGGTIGMYEKAARDAVSAVRKRGLVEQADRLGEIFYRTGEFPPSEEDNT